jgi:hypothetical protein
VPADSTAIAVPSPEERDIARQFGKLVEKSVEVIRVVDRTHEVSRGEDGRLIRPEGMSDADWNLHTDAMQSQRNLPAYLASHMRRVELAQKIAGERATDLPPIAIAVVHTFEPKRYDVIDVTPTKEE